MFWRRALIRNDLAAIPISVATPPVSIDVAGL